MIETIFISALTLVLLVLFRWAFRALPAEDWQIMAAVPLHKGENGRWIGMNLTWYGFFSASAYVFAAAVYFMLTISVGVSIGAAGALLVAVLGICAPAAKLLARLIEGKGFTFTIGGSSFVGIIVSPFLALCLETISGWPLPLFPVMAAIAVAYAFGEGVGRLACVSFGCCYGRPLTDFGPSTQRILESWAFIFTGKTKKIAYERGLDGQKVIPIQAFSAIVNSAAGLSGTVLFLTSKFIAAYMVTVAITQGWRFFSEFLRADYRGHGKISAYQKMNVVAVVYAGAMAALMPALGTPSADFFAGVAILWDPGMILFLQGLWVVFFLYTGHSRVTGSTLDFFVHRDRI